MWNTSHHQSTLALCYYPTTVMLVSDNPNYAASLQALHEAGFIYRCYQQAQDAVQSIIKTLENMLPFSSPCHHSKSIQQWFNQQSCATRYTEASVIILDANSITNWQEACKTLQGIGVQRVLQGASSQQALQAFNQGLIDYVINDYHQDTPMALQQRQRAYFQQRSQACLTLLQTQLTWLQDPVFIDYWQQLQQQQSIVEYYFVTEPYGFSFITANGEKQRLLVYDKNDVMAHIDVAKDQEAGCELINKLQSCDYLPWFPTSDAYYHQSIHKPLEHLYQANRIKGQQDYYCAIAPIKNHQNET